MSPHSPLQIYLVIRIYTNSKNWSLLKTAILADLKPSILFKFDDFWLFFYNYTVTQIKKVASKVSWFLKIPVKLPKLSNLNNLQEFAVFKRLRFF